MCGLPSNCGHPQTKALGVPRSTAWTILQARHKNYGLSEKLIKRMLASQHLPPLVRSKIIEYREEKTAGLYGGPQHSEPDLPLSPHRAPPGHLLFLWIVGLMCGGILFLSLKGGS